MELTFAGPVVLEESARIASPDPSYDFGRLVAVDEDDAIVAGARRLEGPVDDDSAWLFARQADGSWGLVRKLVESLDRVSSRSIPMALDMRDGLAVIEDAASRGVFERTSGGWVRANFGVAGDGDSGDVEIQGARIFITPGMCRWDGRALRRDATGRWVEVAYVTGQFRTCDDEYAGDDGDISGTSMIVANLGGTDESYPGEDLRPQARIYEGFGTTSTMTAIVPPLISGVRSLPRPVAIVGNTALIGATTSHEVHAYVKDGTGAWTLLQTLPNPAVIQAGAAESAEMYGTLAVVGYPGDPLRGTNAGSVGVFERSFDGSYRYVARLVASDASVGHALGRKVEISGRRIIAGAKGAAYVFDVPEDLSQPSTLQDDFSDGDANGWTATDGSAFSVVASQGSNVYRQSSLAGDAGAIMNGSERRNQAIQADIRPTAFAGGAGSRWFGLAVRYVDPGNYYYVTLRSTNVVELKRMRYGVFTTLATKELPITLNRSYRVRLEAVGTRLRVFVDNTFVAEARDSELPEGRAAILTYKTAADHDNIVVTSDPHTRLVNDKLDELSVFWSMTGSGSWAIASEGTNRVLAQTSLSGDARAIIGSAVSDQVVQTRAKATTFGPGGDRWFGLIARYRDPHNYYYLTLRDTNSVSLRMLVNGTPVVLNTAAFPVNPGQWYTLRLEAIGTQVRGYVNGELIVEAADPTHESGAYGAMSYKTAVRYDDFTAMQP